MESALFSTIIVFLLSAILIAVGIYLVLLLIEVRGSFQRINKILDRVETASNFVEQNFLSFDNRFLNIVSVLKEALGFVTELKKTLREDKSNHER